MATTLLVLVIFIPWYALFATTISEKQWGDLACIAQSGHSLDMSAFWNKLAAIVREY